MSGGYFRSFAPRHADAVLDQPQMERLSSPSGVQLAKVLGPFDLIMLGIGGIIGAGVFVLTGVAARQHAGYFHCLNLIVISRRAANWFVPDASAREECNALFTARAGRPLSYRTLSAHLQLCFLHCATPNLWLICPLLVGHTTT